jgi:arabinogalactan endo-1,4-beta-galactosidase
MKKLALLYFFTCLFSCSSDSTTENPSPTPEPTPITEQVIRGADMSFLPLIESEGTTYKHNGQAQDALITLKNAGCNVVRIRLWVNPIDATSSLNEVKNLALRVKQQNMKVWLTVHYSDTWADPSNQTKPVAWQNLSFADLKNSVTAYTAQIMDQINPDIIQIGNETNDGMLWPEGRLSSNESQYIQLVTTAIQAIRSKSTTTKIMLHYAGISGSDWYFSKVGSLDFDYIGLSYYPIWHGKSLVDLQNKMNTLGSSYNKKVVIAETSYQFTLGYNDYTNNIVGQSDQLIPAYQATEIGQKSFISALKNTINESSHGIGFCYWGSEWVAFRGPTSTNGSSWENQALWDFNNNSLPILEAFNAN